jgi:hypothetical protein
MGILMALEKIIRDHNKQINLKEDFYGSIVCKKLLVPVGVKCYGHVIAEEIYIKGQFDGHAQATTFYADETAVLDGAIYADKVMNKSLNQNVRINTRLYKLIDPLFSSEAQVDLLVDAAVEAALTEASLVGEEDIEINENDFSEFNSVADESVDTAAEIDSDFMSDVEAELVLSSANLDADPVAVSAPVLVTPERSGLLPSLF